MIFLILFIISLLRVTKMRRRVNKLFSVEQIEDGITYLVNFMPSSKYLLFFSSTMCTRKCSKAFDEFPISKYTRFYEDTVKSLIF
jgi:hypothetical protein